MDYGFNLKCKIILILLIYSFRVETATFIKESDIHVSNNINRSIVQLDFNRLPSYSLFLLDNPDIIVLDVPKHGYIKNISINFNYNKLIKRIINIKSNNKKKLRIIFELTGKSNVQSVIKKNFDFFSIIITIVRNKPFWDISNRILSYISNYVKNIFTYQVIVPSKLMPIDRKKILVVIDAGHGGQDPGAIGINGLYEKNVTMNIARKLKFLLDCDPIFKAELTRNGDNFISVIDRSNLARKKKARVLISIHTDSALNRKASGSSVWVLSNQRANTEMDNWIEQYEKQYKCLVKSNNNRYDHNLNQAVLDLQFCYSQRVSYDIAIKILYQLKYIGVLHKYLPEYASFGILCSPDIPSILVETGFISNINEEKLLGSNYHQEKIANALYLGLRSYFIEKSDIFFHQN